MVVNFVAALAFSIVLPFLVYMLQDFKGTEKLYGIVTASFPLMQLIGAPLLGSWSDRVGRKRVLLVSHFGTFVSWCVLLTALFVPMSTLVNLKAYGYGLITLPLLMLVLARALDGITGGNIAVANAYLADVTADEERKVRFGWLSMSMNLGFVIGPALGGILAGSTHNYVPVVATVCGIMLVGLFVLIVFLKEPPKLKTDDDKPFEKPNTRRLLNIENVPYMLLLNLLIFLGFNTFYTSFPLHAAAGLGWTETELGIFFVFLSGTMILTQGVLLKYSSRLFSDTVLVVGGLVLLAGAFAMMFLIESWPIYISGILFGLGNGHMWPTFLAILAKTPPKKHQGGVQGLASSAGSVASIAGLILGSYMYDAYGAWAFLISAVVMLVVAVLSLRIEQCKRRPTDDEKEDPFGLEGA
ncbi:MAG: MFS transporter [Bacteroidota bacterium]